MELLALKEFPSNLSPITIPVSGIPIKFFDYNYKYATFVTVNNEIYDFDFKEKNITKLNDLPFKIVKYLICVGDCSIIVNEKNEIFTKGNFYERKNEIFTLLENISLKENITKFKAGENYFLILTSSNSLYGYGINNNGQLGLEEMTKTEQQLIKIDTNYLQKINDIQCSHNHSMILDIFGCVYVTGQNNYGQLALGDDIERFKFTKVELPFKVIKIYADNLTSLIVNENNELYVAGYNEDGELGSGSLENIKIFKKIIINNFNTKRYTFNFSHTVTSFIIDYNNNIFVSGGTSDVVKKYGISIDNNLTEFKEVNIPNLKNRKFTYVMPLYNEIFIVLSDYEINCENEKKESLLGLKVFQKVEQQQLVDINIVCNDNE